jgi:sugar transferase EpsL
MLTRGFDIVVAVGALTLGLPFLAIAALFVRVNLGAPVFFFQERPGKLGHPFWLVKFRTMKDVRDAEGAMLEDKDRMTPFGKFLRSTSIDELPAFWNVLMGHMSLVGPRPLLMAYLPLYSPEQARRHEVRPGITGWAQVNGRNTLSWEEKFALDVWYVDNRSFLLDIRILAMTVCKVVRRSDIDTSADETMPVFKGSDPT